MLGQINLIYNPFKFFYIVLVYPLEYYKNVTNIQLQLNATKLHTSCSRFMKLEDSNTWLLTTININCDPKNLIQQCWMGIQHSEKQFTRQKILNVLKSARKLTKRC